MMSKGDATTVFKKLQKFRMQGGDSRGLLVGELILGSNYYMMSQSLHRLQPPKHVIDYSLISLIYLYYFLCLLA